MILVPQDGAKNESLQVVMKFDNPDHNDTLVWLYSSGTAAWSEGQVELRTVMEQENYLNYKISVMAVKPGDMTAFIAVDDFAFHVTDTCETFPTDAGVTATSSPSTTTIPPSRDSTTFLKLSWICFQQFNVNLKLISVGLK